MGLLKKDKNGNIVNKKIIDNIRGLSIDMINNAKSGHPGICLGAAPIIYSLYAYHLNVDPLDDKWINRDRLVLSAGHASALLYSTLFMSGFNITIDDLKKFRKLNSITPGHPEYGKTPGVDVSTGPLGEGIANAVGMAISEKYLRSFFGSDLIDYNTYVFCSDGDLMEGVSYEAMSLAGHLALNKLIVLYDSNDTTLDGPLKNTFSEDIEKRVTSMRWNYYLVNNGEDINSLNDAISKAKLSDKPAFIEIKTTIGKYSMYEGSNRVHGTSLSEEDIKSIKEKLNLRDVAFSVSDDAVNRMHELVSERIKEKKSIWNEKLLNLDMDKQDLFKYLEDINKPIVLNDLYYDFNAENNESTRIASGKIINSIADNFSLFMGGSADVGSSTKSIIVKDDLLKRNISFGVREHAMGGIINGMALSGITPFASTFLAFSDHLKPSIRMSAMMNLGVIYVFSHDSISVGEDGPTHQPVEQLIGLRSIPNLDVYRPADINETLGVYKNLLETRRPSAIILGRNKVDVLSSTSVNDTKYGAYILEKEINKLDGIIIATGEEVSLASKVINNLKEKGHGIRLVSMPSIECFLRQSKKYRNDILPNDTKIFVIEASSSYSWDLFTKREYMFTVDTFGKSGSKDDLLNDYGFDIKKIENKIEELLK